ncbi:hypothetical protein MAPG_11956 [Magnaporthiopsis poae ATCC 64411]|uniref:Uncharacterized protein n=1 Tax=Magnaporthiopsis poae (strain ATCC 64411 / 73-15) TaxID=644358 RepID=A0A0C4EGK1_MAGP6|nr:hypothetical protein MAPG_11956 [Magnaporthiopsis poae ATCC 64411]
MQQSIASVPWISFTDGAVDRRCEQVVVNAFRSASESYGRPSLQGRRHSFYPGSAGWAEIMHNNMLISLVERAADRRVLAVEVEGRGLSDLVRIRLHELRVMFELLDSPVSENEGPVSEDDGDPVSGDDCGAVSEVDDRPVFEGDGDEALRD